MKKTFLALAAMAMVFATSCNKDNGNTPEEPQDVTDNQFICEIDPTANPQNAPRFVDGIGQMTYIDNDYVYWEEGDEIKYHGRCTNNSTTGPGWYTLRCSNRTEHSRAYFTSDQGYHFGQGKHEAYYPADIITDDEQKFLPNSITVDPNHNAHNLPMYAKGSGPHYLTFHNICAVLEITIPDDARITNCDKIELSADQNICGAFEVKEPGEDQERDYFYAHLIGEEGSHNSITIKKKDQGIFQIGEKIYVAIPEGTYTDFNVKFYSGINELCSTNNNSDKSTPLLTTNRIYPVSVDLEEDPGPGPELGE